MLRKEAILLVSRALSIYFAICVFFESTYIPERLYSFLHYTNLARAQGASQASLYLPTYYCVELVFMFLRTVLCLFLAVVFWTCAPWVQRILLPEREP
jgi:hypothetical protein